MIFWHTRNKNRFCRQWHWCCYTTKWGSKWKEQFNSSLNATLLFFIFKCGVSMNSSRCLWGSDLHVLAQVMHFRWAAAGILGVSESKRRVKWGKTTANVDPLHSANIQTYSGNKYSYLKHPVSCTCDNMLCFCKCGSSFTWKRVDHISPQKIK